MSNRLEIRLLGPFEVIAGGRRVDIPGSKRQALLAMLAFASGRVVVVDDLIDALWGADLPAAPRNAVQHHVARLRAAVGHEAVAGSGDGYALRHATVDAVAFEELLAAAVTARRDGDPHAAAADAAAALGLWRGAPLQGLTYAPWFNAEARRLDALRLDAQEERFDAALALGEHREVVPELRAALDENPYRERLWGQLMLALYRSGRQADALDVFHEARRIFSDSLALEPGPELRALQEAILAHDPAIAAVPVVPVRRGNLPSPATSFIGREAELAQVAVELAEHRIVTLLGPPGVGKTRIALEAAGPLQHTISDGIWFVDLARAAEPSDVTRLLIRAVEARGGDRLARVVERLRDAEAVLLFDSCERLLAEVRRVVEEVLAGCPGVRVLATSREVLHVTGEVRVTVEPLPLEGLDRVGNVDSPAVALFLERARAARPGFELDAESARQAAAIAGCVDGLPLAIELAAARVNVLGLAELLSLVERRVALFPGQVASDAGGALRTLVEWSYDLLHADEKTLLQQVAVHRGGSSLPSLVAAGERHGLDEATVTLLLEALVDKSIITVSFPDGGARYTLLDTVRDYTLDRLQEAGGLAAARRTHAAYFAALAERAREELRVSGWLASMRRLELENDNFWAALTWARDAPDPSVAVRLAAPLGWYFAVSERVSEGRRFLELALEVADEAVPVDLRAEALAALCYLAAEELDVDAASAAGEQALELARASTAPAALTMAQMTLAVAAARSGDLERSATLAEAARRGAVAAHDDWTAAASGLIRAQSAAAAGDVETVATMAADVIAHADAIAYDAFQVPGKLLEGWVAAHRGDRSAAEEAYLRTLDSAERSGLADHAAFAFAGLGSSALAAGNPRRAEQLLRQALAAAEAARAAWVAAHARGELGRVLAAAGDDATAERLYRTVLDWSTAPRPHQGRETLFIALAGDPATTALRGLADLADAQGDALAAGDLRRRAGLALS
jgi:predicted ATPase/DNA-binding SARP family transcriptional activator